VIKWPPYQEEVLKDKNPIFKSIFTETIECAVKANDFRWPIKLNSGEAFSQLEERVFLIRELSENIDKPVGRLVYSGDLGPYSNDEDGCSEGDDDFDDDFPDDPAEPGSNFIECELPERQFDELPSAALLGRMPSAI
jgi:hypothetical protein